MSKWLGSDHWSFLDWSCTSLYKFIWTLYKFRTLNPQIWFDPTLVLLLFHLICAPLFYKVRKAEKADVALCLIIIDRHRNTSNLWWLLKWFLWKINQFLIVGKKVLTSSDFYKASNSGFWRYVKNILKTLFPLLPTLQMQTIFLVILGPKHGGYWHISEFGPTSIPNCDTFHQWIDILRMVCKFKMAIWSGFLWSEVNLKWLFFVKLTSETNITSSVYYSRHCNYGCCC